MKKSRSSEEQVIGIRQLGETSSVKSVCAKHTLSEPTYSVWKTKSGGMEMNEARRLRALEEECSRLKRVAAEQTAQIQILQEVNSKNAELVNTASSRTGYYKGGAWDDSPSLPRLRAAQVELLPR